MQSFFSELFIDFIIYYPWSRFSGSLLLNHFSPPWKSSWLSTSLRLENGSLLAGWMSWVELASRISCGSSHCYSWIWHLCWDSHLTLYCHLVGYHLSLQCHLILHPHLALHSHLIGHHLSLHCQLICFSHLCWCHVCSIHSGDWRILLWFIAPTWLGVIIIWPNAAACLFINSILLLLYLY